VSAWESITSAIEKATLLPYKLKNSSPVGGGSINQAYCMEGADGRRFFVKLNDSRHYSMFIAEVSGLEAIAATNTIRVPLPVTHGCAGKDCYLVLEHLQLGSHGRAETLGEQLAAMHRCTGREFGFPQDNFIGTTPQPNKTCSNWMAFYREHRLGFQLNLAASNGYIGRLQDLGEKLMGDLPVLFNDYSPEPSLLHGDLWGGNHAFLKDGTPTIFDPAAYYGDRECDLAMTELFGGYPPDFYAAYRSAFPLDAGYSVRRDLYNLYHVLNHANLFGGGYARQAEQMMSKLLALV